MYLDALLAAFYTAPFFLIPSRYLRMQKKWRGEFETAFM